MCVCAYTYSTVPAENEDYYCKHKEQTENRMLQLVQRWLTSMQGSNLHTGGGELTLQVSPFREPTGLNSNRPPTTLACLFLPRPLFSMTVDISAPSSSSSSSSPCPVWVSGLITDCCSWWWGVSLSDVMSSSFPTPSHWGRE